jgi:hypothetical protein
MEQSTIPLFSWNMEQSTIPTKRGIPSDLVCHVYKKGRMELPRLKPKQFIFPLLVKDPGQIQITRWTHHWNHSTLVASSGSHCQKRPFRIFCPHQLSNIPNRKASNIPNRKAR